MSRLEVLAGRPSRLRLLVALVAALAMLPLGAVPSAQAKTVTSKVSLGVSISPAMPGESVALSGVVSPAASGRKVSLQRRSGSSWSAVTSVRTNSAGRFKLTVRAGSAGSTTYWRVVARRTKAAKQAISATRTLSVVAQTATLTMPTIVGRNQAGTATVRFTPARAGRAVAVQVWKAGVWTPVVTGRQSSTGTASLPLNTGFAATFSYLASTAAAAGASAAFSGVHTMKVLPGDRLRAGEVLHIGDSLLSSDGRYRLSMQPDGNLVERVVATNRPLWSSQTAGRQGAWAVMQSDGNAVIYDGNGVARWQTRSNGTGAGSSLVLQTDANLVNYNSGGHAVWVSSTKNDRLDPGEVLTAGQWIRSVDGANTLQMQWDGNLVMYNRTGVALWSSRTNNHANAWAVSQRDGNFVVYQGSTALWNTKTGGKTGGGTMVVQTDTNLVLYRGGVATWHR